MGGSTRALAVAQRLRSETQLAPRARQDPSYSFHIEYRGPAADQPIAQSADDFRARAARLSGIQSEMRDALRRLRRLLSTRTWDQGAIASSVSCSTAGPSSGNIDRSGSMSGQPLAEAKRMIIDGLSSRDRAGLVTYDHVADVLVPSRSVDDKHAFHAALCAVESRGNTALHAGWLTGAEQAARHQNGPVLSRVLLLSDGCANEGLCDAPAIAKHCAEMADAGVGTSTYGLGRHFNEELMTAMARAGQGNAYYGSTAEDLMDPFRQEFDLMSALCARGLRLALAPAPDVRVEIVNGYRTDAAGRTMLPDLAYGGEAWALLRLTVPRSVAERGDAEDVHLLTASLTCADLDGRAANSEPVHLRLPLVPASAFAAIPVNELVSSRIAELSAAGAMREIG